jgi:hypothetical protein
MHFLLRTIVRTNCFPPIFITSGRVNISADEQLEDINKSNISVTKVDMLSKLGRGK